MIFIQALTIFFSFSAKGSVPWMAPEVMKGTRYDHKCDIYSLGVIFWEMLTRVKPYFDKANAANIMWIVAHQNKRPENISKIPKLFRNLLERMWHTDPKNRYEPSRLVIIFTNSSVGMLCVKADSRTQKVFSCPTQNTSSNTVQKHQKRLKNTKKYNFLELFQ